VLLTVGEGVIAGLVVAAAAALLDVPSPAALGLAAGVMAMLPHVGIVLGTLPLVLLVLALKSEVTTAVTVVAVLGCQLGDSFWLRRRIAARSVHLGLLVPWVVALVGYEVYGVGGVAYGTALAVFAFAVLDELHRRSLPPDSATASQGPRGTDEHALTSEPGAPPASVDADDAPVDRPADASGAGRPSPDDAGVPV
jgi:predicted PurR-regulated permease PerM